MLRLLPWAGRTPPPVLDRDYLDRLGRRGGRERLLEHISDGALDLADRFGRLEEMARTGPAAAMAGQIDGICVTAGHLGLSALAGACVEAMRAARRPGAKPCDIARPLMEERAAALSALALYCETLRDDPADTD